MDQADEAGIKTLAMPATGTGIAGFDTRRCAEIMMDVVAEHIAGRTSLTDIYFVLYDAATKQVFAEAKRRRLS